MKKLFVPLLSVLLLTACNTNNGGSNASNGVASNPSDSAQVPNRSDTTSTSNSDAYNTTDTGISKGTTTDSSGKHSGLHTSANSGGKKMKQ